MATNNETELRATDESTPEHRAAVIIRRNVLRTMGREDASEHFADFQGAPPSDEQLDASMKRWCKEATDSLGISSDDPSDDYTEARTIYFEAWRAEWSRLTGPAPAPRPGTAHDLKVARIREQLVELVARAWVSGAISGLRLSASEADGRREAREQAIESAPMMVEGALDAILQVLA